MSQPFSFSLSIVVNGHSGTQYPLADGKNTVGRETDNTIVLKGDSVSRHHAAIVVDGVVVTLRDLGSRNGTHVNGVPRREARLQEGDRVVFGSIELVFSSSIQNSVRNPVRQELAPVIRHDACVNQTQREALQLPKEKTERYLAAFYHLCAWISDGVDEADGISRWLELMTASLGAQAIQYYDANEKLVGMYVAEGKKPRVKFAHYLLEKFQALTEPMAYPSGELDRYQARLGLYHFLVAPLHNGAPGVCPVVVVIRPELWQPFVGDDRALLQSACLLWVRSGDKSRQVRELRSENVELRLKAACVATGPVLLGKSDAMNRLRERIARIAATKAPVLVTGETGSGKEVVASAIHRQSPRAGNAFIKLNCAAIPGSLVESELFGHVKGAFTDARSDRKGRFQLADGGTLFLDEIGELPLSVQAKLLRILETGEVEPLGAERTQRVDVRIVAATNRDLRERVRCGEFREDLLYRLEVARLVVPPLREHPEDVPEIAACFLTAFCMDNGLAELTFAADALQWLVRQTYQGNVRELRNIVQRSAIEANGTEIRVADIRAAQGEV